VDEGLGLIRDERHRPLHWLFPSRTFRQFAAPAAATAAGTVVLIFGVVDTPFFTKWNLWLSVL